MCSKHLKTSCNHVEICDNVEICGNKLNGTTHLLAFSFHPFSMLFSQFLDLFANSAEKLKISSSVIGRDGNGHADDGPL